MRPGLLDVVRILEEIPNERISKDAIGVIVEEFSKPEEAYEVEFCDESGRTIAQIVLRPNQFSIISTQPRSS